MELSSRFLLKSSAKRTSRAGSPLPSNRSGLSHSSASSLNNHLARTGGGCAVRHGLLPIAMQSYGLYASASFSSTQPAESTGSSVSQQQKSAEEILRLVAEQKLCVIRKHDTQEKTLVDSIVDGIGRAADVLPLYLHVTQRAAGRLLNATRRNGLPLIYLSGDLIGGFGELHAIAGSEFVTNALRPHDHDLIVMGASAGGIAAATEASLLGKKVVLIDIRSSATVAANDRTLDSGTIRRLLYKAAANISNLSSLLKDCKWNVAALRESIYEQTRHVEARRQNWLAKAHVQVLAADRAVFRGTHELGVYLPDGRIQFLNADKFLLAFNATPTIGERNKEEPIIGVYQFFTHHLLESNHRRDNDERALKALCIGENRRALEVASVACAFGYDAVVLMNTPPEDIGTEFMARICDNFSRRGVRFISHVGQSADAFRTLNVLPVELRTTQSLRNQSAGPPDNEMWPPNVYRLSDPESAQLARNLTRRIYDGYLDEPADVNDISTTVSVPLLYAACGLNTTQAISRYGADALTVYRGDFGDAPFFCQIVCLLHDQNRLLGAQIFAPNAELHVDVFALALRTGARRDQLDAIARVNSSLAEILQCLKPENVSALPYRNDSRQNDIF